MPSADCMDAICAYVCLLSIFWCHSASTNKVGVCSKRQEDHIISTYKCIIPLKPETWICLYFFSFACMEISTLLEWHSIARKPVADSFQSYSIGSTCLDVRFVSGNKLLHHFVARKEQLMKLSFAHLPKSQNWRPLCILHHVGHLYKLQAAYKGLNSNKINPLQQ